ncbi:hypothetical protein OROMI_015204 [Orobanche minor]
METRDASPAHLLIKIESFSLLDECGVDKYETRDFSAGNYKWRLIIYPNGDGTGKDGEHVSAYLAIANTNSLPRNWEVNAVFSIFLLNQISGKYLYTLGWTRRFFGMKTEWGFPKFISKKTLIDPSIGYIFNDSCVFGAEVLVHENKADTVIECVSLKNVSTPYKRDWEISNFSELKDLWTSEEFTVQGFKWKMTLYPNGNGDQTGRNLSIYLMFAGSCNNKTGERVKLSYTICMKNQIASNKHHKKNTSC